MAPSTLRVQAPAQTPSATQAAPPEAQFADELKWLRAERVTAVTAGLRDEALAHTSGTVRVITRRQIEERGYRSLNQLLRDQPGVDVLDHSQPESKNRIAIRGITGNNKFLILQDGIRVNAPTGEPITPIAENFPLFAAKQVEILYGPASALYGADAFTGVINIITETPTQDGTARRRPDPRTRQSRAPKPHGRRPHRRQPWTSEARPRAPPDPVRAGRGARPRTSV